MLTNRQSELMLVGLLVWRVVSVGTFIVLILSFVVPQHQLVLFIPECEWQTRFQKPCIFCGMTSAFYAISRGDFTQAYRLNPLSLYIYSVFALNTFCAVMTLKHPTRFVKNLGAMLHSDNALS